MPEFDDEDPTAPSPRTAADLGMDVLIWTVLIAFPIVMITMSIIVLMGHR